MTHFMLDFETMGNTPLAPVVSIGCVAFKWEGAKDNTTVSDFYRVVDLESVISYGIRPDASTIYWWLDREEKARQSLLVSGKVPIGKALEELGYWMMETEPDRRERVVWGNGADFDNAILIVHWKRIMDGDLPYEFWNNRCFRTIKSSNSKVKPAKRGGTYHNALDDARNQTNHLFQIIRETGLTEK